MAPAVEETGFHLAIMPSQSGIIDGGVKTLEIMPKGKARA